MNLCTFVGRLTRDPEISYSKENQTPIARFSLAVDRNYGAEGEPTADFFPCVAFSKRAEFIQRNFYQGLRIAVNGRMRNDNYTNKKGEKVYGNVLFLDNAEFADGRRENEPSAPYMGAENMASDGAAFGGYPPAGQPTGAVGGQFVNPAAGAPLSGAGGARPQQPAGARAAAAGAAAGRNTAPAGRSAAQSAGAAAGRSAAQPAGAAAGKSAAQPAGAAARRNAAQPAGAAAGRNAAQSAGQPAARAGAAGAAASAGRAAGAARGAVSGAARGTASGAAASRTAGNPFSGAAAAFEGGFMNIPDDVEDEGLPFN